MKPKVLIVSDEPETAQVWGFSLHQVGMDVMLIDIRENVMQIWAAELPDLIILEDFNSQVEELGLCQQLRAETAIPILYLTTKAGEAFLLETYKAGADETIPYPITPRLFQAKVKAWLRRTHSLPLAALDEVQAGGFRLNPDKKLLVTPRGDLIRLTVLESRLLFVMMNHPGRVLDTNHLVEQVWGYYGSGDSVLLKNLVYRLRRKIEPGPGEPRYLITEANSGYKFTPGGERLQSQPSIGEAENPAFKQI